MKDDKNTGEVETARLRRLKSQLDKLKGEQDSIEKKLNDERDRLKRIQAEEAQKKAAANRKLDARRKIIIGGAVIAAMRDRKIDEETVLRIINEFVVSPKERELVGQTFGLGVKPKTKQEVEFDCDLSKPSSGSTEFDAQL